ncbi:MAG: transposase [Spirochaetes bacterium]|nr:transposase [Spirochaetota bacterium]
MRERKANRLSGYDYSSEGAYFVTINTANRDHAFGAIADGMMHLNEAGKIAAQCWQELPDHCANIALDEFCIMPDHVHGIIFIPSSRDMARGRGQACLPPTPSHIPERNHQKLPVAIGAFKSAASKLIHASGNPYFRWHKSYYDRIIRDGEELYYIREYIKNNPVNWGKKKAQDESIPALEGAAEGVRNRHACSVPPLPLPLPRNPNPHIRSSALLSDEEMPV